MKIPKPKYKIGDIVVYKNRYSKDAMQEYFHYETFNPRPYIPTSTRRH